MKKLSSSKLTSQPAALIIGVVVVVLLIIAVGAMAYKKYHTDTPSMENTNANTQVNGSGSILKPATGSGAALTPAEAEVALKNIFAIAHLPVDEDPASSTVKNLDTVKNTPFFKDAKVGDVILFFRKARIAAILRPSESKIISSAQVVGEIPAAFNNLNSNTNSAVTATVNIGIMNGTSKTANLKKIADLISTTFKKDVNIVYQDKANKNTYKTTVVVDLTGGQNAGLAKSIAALLKGNVGDFPAGEKLPPSMKDFPEILIFIGSTLP